MDAFVKSSLFKAPSLQHVAIPTVGHLHQHYLDIPANATCEVFLKVYTSSVNPSDLHPRISNDDYPKALGSDAAGLIVNVSTAPGCGQRLKIGDRVWGDIGANTKTAGGKTKELGGYAQYAVALEAQLAKIPPAMGYAEAGALPKVALTSYKAYKWYTASASWPINASVLVLGGSGGCGTTGIQLAKRLGKGQVHVTTTTSAANAAYVKSLGADRSIDYHTLDWWAPDVIPDDSIDVIYDTVGQSGTGARAMAKLKEGGHYVTITGALAPKVRAGRHQAMFINSDTNLASAPLLEELNQLNVRMPKLDSTFALADVARAFARSETGHAVGKISIKVRDEWRWSATSAKWVPSDDM